MIGFGITLNGVDETRIAWHCRAEPERVTVEQLEQGRRPDNDHLTLGPHLGIRDGCVYWQYIPKGSTEESVQNLPRNPNAQIDETFYPIVSFANPLANNPDPSKGTYAVLVKTRQYHTVREVIDAIGDGAPTRDESLTGVIINDIEPLNPKERALLSKSFPLVSLDNVLIVEQNRIPKSRLIALFMVLLGAAVMLAPIVLWILKRMEPMAPSAVGGLTPMPSYSPMPYAPPATPVPTADSIPPTSARLQPGARVRVSRKNGDVLGTVVKVQAGQASVNIDNGPTVWVATDAISLE